MRVKEERICEERETKEKKEGRCEEKREVLGRMRMWSERKKREEENEEEKKRIKMGRGRERERKKRKW